MIGSATSRFKHLHSLLRKSDEELAAGALAAPAPPRISLDDVRRHVSLDSEYAFLVTSDNALLMGCLGWIATLTNPEEGPPEPAVWDILGGVLARQVQALSVA